MTGELALALRAYRGKTRSAGPVVRALSVLLAIAVALALALVLVPRPDLIALGDRLVLPAIVWLSLAMAGLAVFLYRGPGGLGASIWLRIGHAAASVAAFIALTFYTVSTGVHHGTAAMAEPATPHDCVALGLCAVLSIGAVAMVVGKRATLIGARMAGIVVGCTAGAIAELLLQLHCASVEALHLGVVHGLPLLLAMLFGAWAGPRMLAA